MDKGFPKLGVPFWGVPIIRTIKYLGFYWCFPILGIDQGIGKVTSA